MVYHTVLYHQVFRRDAPVTSFFILTGFDANGIIPHIEGTVVDYAVFTGFDVYAISILGIPGISYINVSHCQVLTPNRMYAPCGGILEHQTIQQNLSTVYQIYHHGTVKIPGVLVYFQVVGKPWPQLFPQFSSFFETLRREP
jgi:hypothetical protein